MSSLAPLFTLLCSQVSFLFPVLENNGIVTSVVDTSIFLLSRWLGFEFRSKVCCRTSFCHD